MPRDLTDNGSNSLSQGAGSQDHDVHVPLSTQHHELASTQEVLSESGSATVGQKASENEKEKSNLTDDDEGGSLPDPETIKEYED